jgi:hypothetical protein
MTFSPEWLDLREQVDHASRDAGLLARAMAVAGPDGLVVDLGSGTGSTARAFGAAHWRFVDGDAGLLEIAKARYAGCETCLADLGDVAALPFGGAGLVTASALLDLMPRAWVETLAARLVAENLPFYAALSYNGRMSWVPEHAEDAAVTAAFNAHQCGDKGLGAALGGQSGLETAQIFADAGFDVVTADSPWRLGADDSVLQGQLLDGIAMAAHEAGYARAFDWLRDRKAAMGTGYIGHTDVLAIQRKAGK